MKDAARLAAYFAATILTAAVVAPLLFWAAQSSAGQGLFPFLARYGFETFFHRAILIAAVILLWPFLHLSNVRSIVDLRLAPNPHWGRDISVGIFFSAIPLLCCGGLLVALDVYSFRHNFAWAKFGKLFSTSVAVPLIEEAFFRGIVLGVLLRTGRQYMSIFATSAIFSIVHFLKAPQQTSTIVTWTSGLNSVAHSFGQFSDPMMLVSAFATLFLIGWILADARILTRSLWLPIGLHGGWIFASGAFNLMARQQNFALPWLGKNLLVGIVPLGVAGLTWIIMRAWLKYDRASQV